MGNRWYGRHGMVFAGVRNNMTEKYAEGTSFCEQCRCTCDQTANPKTVRSFYTGKIEPQQQG